MWLWRGFLRTRIFVAILLIVSALALGLFLFVSFRGGQDDLPVLGKVPFFALTNQDGLLVTSEDLSDKVWVASLAYTSCADTCLLLSTRMRSLQNLLKAQELPTDKVAIVSFSVDPEKDTPGVLMEYATKYGADPQIWTFLTGDPLAMKHIITDGLRMAYQRLDGDPIHVHQDGLRHRHAVGDYEVMHATRLVLVDENGRVRAYYRGLDVSLDKVVRDMENLIRD